MLNLSKTYFYLFCGLLISLFLSPVIFGMADELVMAMILFLGMLDMFYNRSWRKYKIFFIGTAILAFYMFYSVFAYSYNVPRAILDDFVIWMKPVIAFGIAYGIAPKFTRAERKVIRIICSVLCVLGVVLFFTPLFWVTFFHYYYLGCTFLCSAVVFLITADSDEKVVIWKNINKVLIILIGGLVCGRSKYFGSAFLILFLIYIYRPNIFTKITAKNLMVVGVLIAGVFAVSWDKIELYFITGADMGNAFDPELLITIARPMLYLVGLFVLWDHLLLGSGLASFATMSSSTKIHYSELYYDYGLDNVWGLSPTYDSFVGDTFYPALAQFGLVGIVLFIYVWYKVIKRLKLVIRINGMVPYIVGIAIVAMLLIDSVAAPGIINIYGEILLSVLGLILASVRDISKEQAKEIIKQPIELETSLWRSVRTV